MNWPIHALEDAAVDQQRQQRPPMTATLASGGVKESDEDSQVMLLRQQSSDTDNYSDKRENFNIMTPWFIKIFESYSMWPLYQSSVYWLFRVYDEDPDEAMRQCQVLLEESDLDNAVRVGDVFGMMIEHFARQENFKKVTQE